MAFDCFLMVNCFTTAQCFWHYVQTTTLSLSIPYKPHTCPCSLDIYLYCSTGFPPLAMEIVVHLTVKIIKTRLYDAEQVAQQTSWQVETGKHVVC